jgi:2',5'-phosphodiesterase
MSNNSKFISANPYPDIVHAPFPDDAVVVRTTDETNLEVHVSVFGSRRAFNRPRSEEAAKTVDRIIKTINKGQATPINLALSAPAPGCTNDAAWQNGAVLTVGDRQVPVFRDEPMVLSLGAPALLMVSLPSVPFHVDTACAPVDKFQLNYVWTVKQASSTRTYEGKVFTPTPEDVGAKVFLLCYVSVLGLDGQVGRSFGLECGIVRDRYPGMFSSFERLKHTQNYLSGDNFRVMTYNVLYDANCDTPQCREHIYPFADVVILNQHYRNARLCWEILESRPDVVFLQEVGEQAYTGHYAPILIANGYKGKFQTKSRGSSEGIAMFYRSCRFEIVEDRTIFLEKAWEGLPPDVKKAIMGFPHLPAVLSKMTTVGIVARLREIHTKKELVFGGTHLYYHNDAAHVRLIQAYTMALECLTSARGDVACPIVVCGDLNCPRGSGVHQLLTNGTIPGDHPDWVKGASFAVENMKFDMNFSEHAREPKAVPAKDVIRFGVDLRVPESLVFEEATKSYPYTMYSPKFTSEVFDYIFVHRLRVTLPLPTIEESALRGGIPNAAIASDHISLVVEVSLS